MTMTSTKRKSPASLTTPARALARKTKWHIRRFTRTRWDRVTEPRHGGCANLAFKETDLGLTPIRYQTDTRVVRLFRLADSCYHRGRRDVVVLLPGLETSDGIAG